VLSKPAGIWRLGKRERRSATISGMCRFSRWLAFLYMAQGILAIAHAQTATVSPANEAVT